MPRRELILTMAIGLLLVLAGSAQAAVRTVTQYAVMMPDAGSFAESSRVERFKTHSPLGARCGRVQEVRRLWPSEWGAPHPLGLSYSVERDQLALIAGRGRVVVISPYEDLVATVDLAFAVDYGVSIAYDDANDSVLLLDQVRSELGRVAVGTDGAPDVNSLERFDVSNLGMQRVSGMDVDVEGRRLVLMDSGALRMVIVALDRPLEVVDQIELSHLGDTSLREIAVHPDTGHVFVMGAANSLMYELTQRGVPVSVFDVAELGLVDVQGIDFGPSSDLTDEPDTVHLFLADSNVPDSAPSVAIENSTQVFGAILEVAIFPKISIRCDFNHR